MSISLEVGHLVRYDRLVDRELLVVGSNSVSVCVRVGEESGLENGIGRRLDSGDHVRWVESDLLDLGKVVLLVNTTFTVNKQQWTHKSVLVQGVLSDGSERVLLVRPNVSQIEDVDPLLLPSLFGLLLRHDLNLKGPRGEVALLDRLVEVFLSVIV